MVRLTKSISRLRSKKVLVVGDLMLDTYTIGKARRISPEAPVPVIQVVKEESRPGGAGNVMLNLISLGAEVVALGRIGHDAAGEFLKNALKAEKINIQGVLTQADYATPLKNRIIAENQQVVRIDHEQFTAIPELFEQQVIDLLPVLFEQVTAIAISDYGKGFLSRALLEAVIERAKKMDIPIITDPKGSDFTKYSGTTVIKPNLSEAYAAAGLSPHDSLDLAAPKILQQADAKILMITKSEAGISIFHRHGDREDFPVKVREVKDVTGAGDTVLAILTLALANGLNIAEASQLSNVGAGIAIERFGCARISLSDLAKRLLETNVENKVVDQDHLLVACEALKDNQYALLALNEKEGMSTLVFAAIRQLSCKGERELMVYINDPEPNPSFIQLLSSLQEVSLIVADKQLLARLCVMNFPKETFVINKGELTTMTSHSLLYADLAGNPCV